MRKDYRKSCLAEGELAAKPLVQFDHWLREAQVFGVLEPNAMSLATADSTLRPCVRTVLLKGMDERGLVFYTNYGSRKARELAENPRATALFPWLALERQVIIEGEVEKVAREESETYFRQRPRASQLAAWASCQSSVISDRPVLEENLRAADARFGDGEVSLPEFWGGYRLIPDVLEFWQGRPNRLHDRLRYRVQDSAWVVERLAS